jgi:arylsulfatase A-like enzyme
VPQEFVMIPSVPRRAFPVLTGMLLAFTIPLAAQQTTGVPCSPSAKTTVDGRYLPNPPARFGGVINLSARDSKSCWPATVVPPKGAPNVLLIMTDDAGYGISSSFGGVIPTPALDRIAAAGVKYTQFHSTALCSPTRAALITGRNHHSVGFGVISEQATGYPGYNSIIGPENATVGEILRENGYATSWFGKNHNTPAYQYSAAGPFTQWPIGMGFDYFYGFMGGETDQWTPYLFRNTTPVYPWIGKPGYNLTTDMADDAIEHIRQLKAAAPEQPFFVYYAPGGTHAPHQPTPEWIARIHAMHLFDNGWNALRDTIFANQKRLGVIPANTQLTAWPDLLPRWETLTPEEKKLFIKQVEVFAAYVAYTDHEIGRVIQTVQDLGELDNTLVIYIEGDNGNSAEGSMVGTPNEYTSLGGMPDIPIAEQMKFYDVWGSDLTYPHMAVPWTWAFDTPFKWTKQVASFFGGTRQGMAMSWPGHIPAGGGVRTQFHHMIDITPTILEATGIQAPQMVDGVAQRPIEGVSMAYSWPAESAHVKSHRQTQYFEMFGNRALYHDGWIAVTVPPAPPWLMGQAKMPEVVNGYPWELYQVDQDYSENNNVAAANPAKLQELQELFMVEAAKYNVFPLDNQILERILSPRPSATAGRTTFTYNGSLAGIPLSDAPSVLTRSFTITADVVVPKDGGNGMLVTAGGRFGGWGFYVLKGKPVFTYDLADLERFRWAGTKALTPGKHTLVFDFIYKGPGFGKGGDGVLSVDGAQVSTLSIPRTIPFLMAIDETFDVGSDLRTGVNDADYSVPFTFSGTIGKVTVKLGEPQLTAAQVQQQKSHLASVGD